MRQEISLITIISVTLVADFADVAATTRPAGGHRSHAGGDFRQPDG
jgi:hypothetical protein